jgi:hypothetical protein
MRSHLTDVGPIRIGADRQWWHHPGTSSRAFTEPSIRSVQQQVGGGGSQGAGKLAHRLADSSCPPRSGRLAMCSAFRKEPAEDTGPTSSHSGGGSSPAAINAGQPTHIVSLVVRHKEGRKRMTLGRYWSGADDLPHGLAGGHSAALWQRHQPSRMMRSLAPLAGCVAGLNIIHSILSVRDDQGDA